MDTKTLMEVCLVAVGGAGGAVLRHFAGLYLNRDGISWPLGTLAVNLAGCFLIGLLYGWGVTGGQSRTRALVATGFLGALTTMSAFSLETWEMAENGNRLAAFAYAGVMVVGCLASAALGAVLARSISGGEMVAGSGE